MISSLRKRLTRRTVSAVELYAKTLNDVQNGSELNAFVRVDGDGAALSAADSHERFRNGAYVRQLGDSHRRASRIFPGESGREKKKIVFVNARSEAARPEKIVRETCAGRHNPSLSLPDARVPVVRRGVTTENFRKNRSGKFQKIKIPLEFRRRLQPRKKKLARFFRFLPAETSCSF